MLYSAINEMIPIKENLFNQCEVFVQNRYETINNTIKGIQKSLLSETKSSAGDKHETGRAMLQLEREKAGNQLAEIQKVKEQLAKISIVSTSEIIKLGSVVRTNKANYFMAISAGVLNVKEEMFYAIAPNTPIGQLLLSKKVGDVISFRDNTFTISSVI